MKTIGLIGGMSWESTAHYYRLLNEGVRARLGGSHSARLLLASVDFAEYDALMQAGEWAQIAERLAALARDLERGGADFLILCTNTMHRECAAIEGATQLPLLHIADPTARAIAARGFSRIGLLGTAFTMEQAFYRDRLRAVAGIEAIVPNPTARAELQRIIFAELVQGQVKAEARAAMATMIADLAASGAEAVVLGCTELMLLADVGASPVPLFDTTTLHAAAAVERALG